MPDRSLFLTPLVCLLLPICASGLDTGVPETPTGKRGDEIIHRAPYDKYQSLDLNVPIEPVQADEVEEVNQGQLEMPTGEPAQRSRQAGIVEDYESDDVGIKIKVPNSENTGFRFKLIDNTDEEWMRSPH